ncbi:tryptophan-rich sensory protein [Gammaproteobacteria bacterium]|nr:tryptophan-rich sensory protein [Gammaproteobacteria bacterium]MDA8982525.1 tryptophan-rich sensory protein [Gammaproteobacteria bacterium]MDA9997279.1 tryptophan-rich sensory protein [Gammaproteobacteria bacterium]MDC1123994.1 tryptophan-rich sensory protein [Gammaproteobacteria bacterium]
MLRNKYLVFLYVLIALILGGLSSSNTASDLWYQDLIKSSLNPPGYVFGIVWPILYILMGISAFLTYLKVYKLFIIQLIFNTMWSWLFFAFHLPVIALIDIYLLIGLNIYLVNVMWKINKLAAYLFLPYIAWLIFASHLNLVIVLFN